MDSKLYFDFMSQPSRACLLFCRVNGLPVKEFPTPIHKGATRTPEFRELNPLGKVPLLEAGNLRLPESGAILTYLAHAFLGQKEGDSGLPWPVVSAIHWHHSTIRAGSAQLVFNLGAIPLGQQVDEAAAKKALAVLKQSLGTLQDFWLRDGPFIAGEAKPSIADMQAACELEQLMLLNKVSLSN
ncbi:glutathione transferase [Dunaliella salina]|uniref:Glutathione transferase n=1 Tax=Dunaliella salina TaxID=3046 RepID=A0ABQ7G1C9_DUNSA|nr:glutathione transferase [Dunaliella salina]|eukprot:KAF5828408.1 glutathione transferase [Dunaliella salina]